MPQHDIEPHPALADSMPPGWIYNDSQHDSDDDRNDAMGIPAHLSRTFSVKKWREYIRLESRGKIPCDIYPPPDFESEPT